MNPDLHFIDSHCHVHFGKDPQALAERIKFAHDSQVRQMLCISIDETDRDEVIQLSKTQPSVLAAAAIHPTHDIGTVQSEDFLLDYCSDERLIAVGETGLDYFHVKEDVEWQKQRFVNHINAAIELKKPLIIHTRDSMSDTLDILEKNYAGRCRGIMHCFTGSWDDAKRALDLDFKISFSGIVTFNSARDLQEVAKLIPPQSILIETDSPYLAPVPYRGKANQPAYVINVADKLSQLRGESISTIAAQTTANFYDLFPQVAE